MLRMMLGPKWKEVTGERRKSFSEELHNLYSPPNIIGVITLRRVRWAEYVTRMTEKINLYQVLERKLDKGDHLGIPNRRCKGGIEVDFE